MKKILIYLIVNLIIFNGCDVKSVKENKIPTSPVLSSPSNKASDIKLDAVLKWTASTDEDGDALKYNVYFGTENPPTTSVSTSQSEILYTPTLKSNTTYYWKVSVNDGNGGVSESEIWSFKTITLPPSLPVLTSPANLASDISINSNLTWTASTSSSSNDIKYKVLLDTSSTFTSSVKMESTLQTGISYTLTNLLSNINYYWKLIAVDGNGLMTESDVRKFKSLLVPPSVPTLTAPANGAIEVTLTPTLTWSASISSSGYAVKYNVYLGTEMTSIIKASSLQTVTTYIPMALSQNTKYYLKIESDDGNGGVNQSEIDSFTTIFADLIYVEGGTFTMGCTSEQEYACLLIEKPSHSVTLSSYFIGKYEVTQSQWVSVMGTNPSIFQNCDDCPVEGVTWDVVQTFLIKLNIKTGKNYRLPT